MKIGILTFWESTDNYGQVLQAYALQQTLKKLGHKPFQIRYSLAASNARNKTSLLKKIIKILCIYPLVKGIKSRKLQKTKDSLRAIIEKKNTQRLFAEFRETFIDQSSTIYRSIQEIRLTPPEADVYITGSDQVWRMLLNNEGNEAYYLIFGPTKTKRISYAASFGMAKYPSKLQPNLSMALKNFDAVSVREKEGVDICREAGVSASQVLDPTLLLSSTEYLNLSNINKQPNKKHQLFVYSINIKTPEDICWTEIINFTKKWEYKIDVTTSSGNIPGQELYEGVQYSYLTIPEWIIKIAESEVVATTSFHGLVFCLLFHTNFIVFPLGGADSIANGRIKSLLHDLDLEYKIYDGKSSVEKIILSAINWTAVDTKLANKKKLSLDFLEKSLI